MISSLLLFALQPDVLGARVDELADYLKKPVVFEWCGETQLSLFAPDTEVSVEDNLKSYAKRINRLIIDSDGVVVLAATEVLADQYKLPRFVTWSDRQASKEPRKKVPRNEVGDSMFSSRGTTPYSVQELADLGHMTTRSIHAWFRPSRLLISGTISDRALTEAVGRGLGGTVNEGGLLIDAKSFRQRRLRFAQALEKRAGVSELDRTSAGIEASTLPLISEYDIGYLFGKPENDLVVPVTGNKAAEAAVNARLDFMLEAVSRGGSRSSFDIAEGAAPEAWLKGTGEMGGRILLSSGLHLHF